MNPRQFKEETGDFYYYFNPPWIPYENQNVVKRLFRLKEEYETVFDSIEKLSELESDLEEEDGDYEEIHREARRAIFDLINGLEVFIYNFSELVNEEWFGSFWQSVASATWRAEQNRFESNPESLATHIRDILDHTPSTIYTGIRGDFQNFIEFYGREIEPSNVPENYQADVYEARDLFCLGYYSTALLVLGRAVEKALLELGHKRKIETLQEFGSETSWDNARFYSRKEALKEIQKPGSSDKMISQRQYHEISVLVDYRNNVAHSEYENLEKEEALRQINNAYSLLNEICELIEQLDEIPDDDIESILGQTVN